MQYEISLWVLVIELRLKVSAKGLDEWREGEQGLVQSVVFISC